MLTDVPPTDGGASPDGAITAGASVDGRAPAADRDLPDGEDAAYEDERARVFLAGGAYATVAIDRYDDLAAIFGKIDTAASPRVALVARRGNQELQRALSMRRLQRHLDLHGKELILVTRSRPLRLRAREEDLPAVGSLRRVNFQTYGQRGLHLGWLALRLPSLSALAALVLLVIAVLGGLAALAWYLPTAAVTVYLPVTPQEATFALTLDPQAATVDLPNGVIPAKRREVVVTRAIYRPATGAVPIPTSPAAVALRFTNRTNGPVRVPAGTVVIADNGTRFTVGNDINLPRANASADVVALAQVPGTVGNVPANSVRRIEGDLGFRVVVTNPAPGEKGTDVPQQVVAEADREGVRSFADAVLIDAATQELRQRFGASAMLFPGSATVSITEVVAVPPVGAPAKYTEVTVTGRVSMLSADDADLRQVYVARFRPHAGPDEMLLEEEFRTVVERTDEPERATDRVPVVVRAQAATAPYVDRRQLRAALAGVSRTEVERVIRQFVESPAAPQVRMSPGWARWLPRQTDRIAITFAAVR